MELQVSTMTLCPPKPPFALSSFTAAFAPWVSSVSESAPGIEYEINENLTGDFALAPLLLPVLAMAATPDAQARAATTSPAVACFRRISVHSFLSGRKQWLEAAATLPLLGQRNQTIVCRNSSRLTMAARRG